jgi:hypothetical protein
MNHYGHLEPEHFAAAAGVVVDLLSAHAEQQVVALQE